MALTYDLAFSLGQACACSMSLRLARLQFASFPFDWVVECPLTRRIEIILSGFDHWFDASDFVYDGTNAINGLGNFHNIRTGMHHPHDFQDGPIELSYANAAAKYHRRTTRLLTMLEHSEKILCVCVDKSERRGPPPPAITELSDARTALSAAYPNAAFDFIHFALDRDIPFDRRRITTPADGIMEIKFDYHHDTKDVDCKMVAQALQALGIKVRDYRTKAERNAHRLKKQMKKYGVNTRLELFLAKAKDRISRLLGRKTADTRKPS